jgi:hypothetical protein
MKSSHTCASARNRASDGCRAALSRVPAGAQQSSARHVHASCTRVSSMAPVVAFKFQQSNSGQSRPQKPSGPVARKTAKTTLFYTKLKEDRKDNTSVDQSTDSLTDGQRIFVNDAAPAATPDGIPGDAAVQDRSAAQQEVRRASSSSPGADGNCDSDLSSSASEVSSMLEVGDVYECSTPSNHPAGDTSGAPFFEEPHDSAHDSSSYSHVDVSGNTQGICVQLHDPPGPMSASECGDPEVVHIKVPPHVKRPWEHVPKAVTQPLIVSEGAAPLSAISSSILHERCGQLICIGTCIMNCLAGLQFAISELIMHFRRHSSMISLRKCEMQSSFAAEVVSALLHLQPSGIRRIPFKPSENISCMSA